MKYLLLALCGFMHNAYADTQVYQSMDKSGTMVVGNKPPSSGGQLMDLPPLLVVPASQMQGKQQPQLTGKESKRRLILQEELTREQQALKEAQTILAQSSNIKTKDEVQNKERSRILQDAINEHQKNISILNKQLGY